MVLAIYKDKKKKQSWCNSELTPALKEIGSWKIIWEKGQVNIEVNTTRVYKNIGSKQWWPFDGWELLAI